MAFRKAGLSDGMLPPPSALGPSASIAGEGLLLRPFLLKSFDFSHGVSKVSRASVSDH